MTDSLVDARSSIEFHQMRGRLPDLIEEVISIYEDFMVDDDFDQQRCLDRMAAKLRTARDFYNPATRAKDQSQ